MTTHVALLTAASAARLDPEARALGLDVADASAGIALLRGDGARRGTRRGFMAGLAAIVAETLLRRAILCNVPH